MSDEAFVHTIIALGSNVEKERYLPEAIRLLRRHRRIEVRDVSRFFESASVGGPDDAPDFFNAAVIACTDLTPAELRSELRHIEDVLGEDSHRRSQCTPHHRSRRGLLRRPRCPIR